MTDAIDTTAVEVGTEVAVVEHHQPAGLFRTEDPVEVVEKAVRVADALKAVIVSKQLFTMIQGKAHVGVEGWTLLGSMLGVTAVCTHTEKLDDVTWKATVEARDQHGRVVGQADALCSGREKRGPWKNADDYARCSMAQTRATSKALKGPLGFVLSLAGYATTPAEEMTFAEPDLPTPVSSSPAQASGGRPVPPAGPAAQSSEDPWPDRTVARVKKLGMQTDIRDKLANIGVVIPKGAHVAPVLPRLTGKQRQEIDGWLGLLERAA
jgi:hypothetical protein